MNAQYRTPWRGQIPGHERFDHIPIEYDGPRACYRVNGVCVTDMDTYVLQGSWDSVAFFHPDRRIEVYLRALHRLCNAHGEFIESRFERIA